MSNIAIKVENLSKAYQLGEIGTGTVSRDLERWWAKTRGKEDPFLRVGETNDRSTKGTSDIVWSLKDLDFEIEQGDAVGIIGRNGAGKSTLLKILSRVTSPTTGSVKIRGRIASLLEVGTGFHPELTGRENIFLNGAILGMRKAEIKKHFDAIVDFSGVERYVDTPVKRYSSGMYVRLAFAVAAHLESEILIVDEVLAVGDAEFQKKCLGKMGDVSKGEGRTVLFVSHNMGSISQLCTKGMVLENGILNFSGNIQGAMALYSVNQKNIKNYISSKEKSEISYKEIQLTDAANQFTNIFNHTDDIYIRIQFSKFKLSNYRSLIIILDQFKNRIAASEASITDTNMTLKLKAPFLTRGNYSLTCIIYTPAVSQFDLIEECCNFEIIDGGSPFSHLADFDYGRTFGPFVWI
jgi:lipopolysaccharide transport system ATP-binding protein